MVGSTVTHPLFVLPSCFQRFVLHPNDSNSQILLSGTFQATDDLVHKYAHRTVRGMLLAVGRPDGRMWGQTKTEQAVVLGMKQVR